MQKYSIVLNFIVFANIYQQEVILSMILKQEKRNCTSQGHRSFHTVHFSPTFDKTNALFQKGLKKQSCEFQRTLDFQSKFNSKQITGNKKSGKETRQLSILSIEEKTDVSSINFFYKYMEKLKRQKMQAGKVFVNKNIILKASTQSKKTEISQERRKQNEDYQTKFTENFRRLGESRNPSGNSTIPVLSEKGSKKKRQQISHIKVKSNIKQASWANKEKIQELIRGVRNSRNKYSALGQAFYLQNQKNLSSISDLKRKHSKVLADLPKLKQNSRIKNKWLLNCNRKLEVTQNLYELEPWSDENKAQEFSILQFDQF